MTEIDWKNPQYAEIYQRRARILRDIRENPDRLPYLKRYYRDHPADFIDDWGITFDPRIVDRKLPARVPFILFPKQREWVDWVVERWKAGEPGVTDKSRDLGMSWLSVSLACTLAIFYEGFTAGFGSRKEEYVDKIGSPKSLFWKAREFMRCLPTEFRAGHNPAFHAPHLRLSFPHTGSGIYGEAGDNIGRGDRASIFFVDEAAHLERPMLVEASLSATTNCRIDISSANGTTNPFYDKRTKYPTEQIFTLHWRDDPRKDDAWYAKQCENLDPVTVAQEIDINYSASVTGVIIPSVWVQSAVDAHVKLGIQPTGARRGALDIADEGRDANAWASARGILVDRLEEWSGSGSDIFATTQHTFGLCDELGLTDFLYDADGMGAGVRGDARVLNELRDHGGQVAGRHVPAILAIPFRGSGEILDPESQDYEGRENQDYFANRKAQSWGWLRKRFKETYRAVSAVADGQPVDYDPDMIISLSSDLPGLSKLLGELSQPTWGPNMTGKMVVNKQPDGSRSPNLADAVMILMGRNRMAMMISDEALAA
jgi:hypothetical protein